VLTLARRRVRRRPSLARSRSRFGILLLLPFLIVNVAVVGLPSLATGYLSFTDWTGVGAVQWIGAGNYRRLLGDAEFRSALTHTLVWTAILLAVPTAMALCGAAILARLRRGRLILRLLFFLPYTVATVVTSSVWQDLLDPERGVGPQLARIGIGWPGDAALLGNGETALAAVASINVWALWGFQLVIFLSAMQGVDEQLYEAARIDGANVVRQFWHVTLPGILPTFVFVVLIGVVWSLLAFDYVWIATHGGPAGATELVGTLVYREAFERYEVGYAATMGLSLTVISGLVTAGFVVLKRRGWTV
jgi:raffinose/stachyose/melibiose transport system permease protein